MTRKIPRVSPPAPYSVKPAGYGSGQRATNSFSSSTVAFTGVLESGLRFCMLFIDYSMTHNVDLSEQLIDFKRYATQCHYWWH